MTALLEFAISTEYKWNAKVGRFQYRDSGKFAPREAVLNLTRQTIAAQSAELIGLGDRLSSGELSLKEFQQQAGELVRQIHLGSAVLGKGGLDKMKSSDYLTVARTLKVQYYQGKDKETDRRFGLKWLCQDIIDGKVSPAQLKNRLSMYADAGMLSYYAAEKTLLTEQGKKEAKRVLADSDRACPECYAFGQMGWLPLNKIVLPTQQCSCKSRCRCVLKYR